MLSEYGGIGECCVFYPHGFLTSANVIDVDDSRVEGESWLGNENAQKHKERLTSMNR